MALRRQLEKVGRKLIRGEIHRRALRQAHRLQERQDPLVTEERQRLALNFRRDLVFRSRPCPRGLNSGLLYESASNKSPTRESLPTKLLMPLVRDEIHRRALRQAHRLQVRQDVLITEERQQLARNFHCDMFLRSRRRTRSLTSRHLFGEIGSKLSVLGFLRAKMMMPLANKDPSCRRPLCPAHRL